MSQWVKVEFFGRVPDGQTVTNVDVKEVAENLGRIFGFTHIDGLSVVTTNRGTHKENHE